ncbi:HlyD family secretion protein [Bradyrhizobium arachidis]|uniref:HlyD family secretion protein n=1 Tax=Bradyrhizobium arachidis TaxID=858423 RepID=A0AAE7NM28_9BRAD|nr:HlyD family secretion protein [Bradyrhizobium arachidis]QOZ67872.1 HlyD family secretion protein [Bradyrhizobium arachidis]SFV10414.1 Multidrug resistance efflux pump [Bradyrhizobium arachidis]
MEILLTLTYVAICVAIFKIFRIPVNQWTLATAALGGIFGLALLFITMAYNQPFSTNARIYFTTVAIIPSIKGRVIEVPVQGHTNQHLEAGDVLFKIDPKPYEYVVAEKRAGLADAEANVAQLKASVDQAAAATAKAKTNQELAQINYDRQKELFEKNVVAQATLDTATRNLDASKQATAETIAAEDRTRQAYGATVDGEHSAIVRLRNELADAQYDLDQTVVRAPTGGFVAELALRPGVYVVPAPFRPAMVFVNDSPTDRALVAAFQQNALQRVNIGNEAEVLFKAVPGRVFKAKVSLVIDVVAAGQLQTSGTLYSVEGLPEGRALVRLDLVDDISGYKVPLGSAGEAAIYTEHFHELSLLRKILLRMRSWQNYVFPEAL